MNTRFQEGTGELQTSAQALRFALASLLAGAVAALVALYLTVPDQPVRLIGPAAIALLTLLCGWLLHRGLRRRAAQFLALGLWPVVIFMCAFNGGLRTPVVIAFPIIILLTAWLFGARSTLLAGAMAVVVVSGLWWAETAGALPARTLSSVTLYAMVQLLLTVLAVFLVYFVVSAYEVQLQRLGRLRDALAAQHHLLKTIVDTAPVRVFWKDQDLRYLGCNPAFARDAGQSDPASLVGKRDSDLAWRDHAQAYTEDDRAVMGSGVPKYSYDEQQTTPDGRLIWLRTSKVPLRNAAQETIGVLGIYEDITDRKRTELALQDSEARARALANTLRMLCDNVPDLIWAKDLNNRYIFANKAMCEQLLCAKDTDEPIGKDDMFFAARERAAHPDAPDWHTFGELCRDSDPITLRNGKATQFDEFGNVRGQFLFLDVHKAPFVNEQGAVLGVVGSGRNVTQQKIVEERLNLASLVLEQSSEALMITDADNRIVEVNPAFTAVTGYGREEALGATPSLMKSGHQGAEFYRQMWSALHADGQWQGEIVNRNKAGELFAEWLSISTLFAENGAVHRRVALFSNVTEKKKRDELIWRQANFDMLTELPNRRMFHDRLRQEMLKTQRSGLKLVLLFLDLDRFKHVNDTLGHDKGDVLLQQVARRISACVRESDTVARLGGDEFTVILTNIDAMDSVDRIATHIIQTLSQPFDIGADVAHISASVGIAQYPSDTTDVAQLLNMADQAMYAAKNAGRSRVVHYTAALGRPPD